jgi:hypothetical protein
MSDEKSISGHDVVYWIGVFTGTLPKNSSNGNPDTWIHGGLFVSSSILLTEALKMWKERRARKKALKASRGLGVTHG